MNRDKIKDLPSVDQAVKKNSGNGFEVLGAAKICHFLFEEERSKNLFMLDNYCHLNNPQCALGILYYYLGTPKLVYSFRTNTPARDARSIEKFR